jgi:hypothetical protein
MRRLGVLMLMVGFLVLLMSGAATAQDGGATPVATDSGLVGDLIGFFTNEALAVTFALLVGIVYKFSPKTRNLANAWIPVVTAFAGWMAHVFMPTPAIASPLGDLARGAGGLMFPVVMGMFDSWASRKIFEGWLRQPTDAWEKPRPDVIPTRVPARR